ncbi:NHL domain-containing protein [Occallatibacter riparius]|uniref:Choice-of-anchor D domain-containing protein n=1 Tax=Occallatibacter riparius TaxID=1002689 RepID=A0A9J7BQC2_9BACT|nr:choice-of-anchor D domain-containing protein [Occallatibacter riparius]UWZ83946.1 choice-of-anchor D domain-containing protein [Occallatibacter riparius]
MSISIKPKFPYLSALALALAFSASAQIVNTVAGGGSLNGKKATDVSLSWPPAIAIDASGNLFCVVASWQVYKVSPEGIVTLVAGNGGPGPSGDGGSAISAAMGPMVGFAVDRSGNLFIADRGVIGIRKVDAATGTISIFAGNGMVGYSGDGGPATSAQLGDMSGLAVDDRGNLYIADSSNNAIRKVDASTGIISTVAGNGTPGYSGDGAAATKAQLGTPWDVAVDSSGNLYIADSWNSVIRKVDASTGIISTVAGNGEGGYSGDGGPATRAQLSDPTGVAVDSTGNLYIADWANLRTRKVDAASGNISTIAGNGTTGDPIDGGPATSSASYARDVVVDTTGKLYIADAGHWRIRAVDLSSGILSTVAGNGYASYSGDGFAAVSAQIDQSYGVAVDGSGNLYIADTKNLVVRKVDAATGRVSTVAGNGKWGYSGDGGPARSAMLGRVLGLAVDTSGNIYIADPDNGAIRKVDATTGDIFTVPSNGIGGYYPRAVAVDKPGSLYIADSGNQKVRLIDASTGDMSTIAGTGNTGYSGDGGLATGAELNIPAGLALDRSGNLYIADSENGVIREVVLDPNDAANHGKITTVAGGASSQDPSNALGPALSKPIGVYVDYAGTIFISDNERARTFKVTGSSFSSPEKGTITVVAGTGQPGYSGDGGLATAAEFNKLYMITGDPQGNLVMADGGNNRIRTVSGTVAPTPELGLSPTALTFDTQLLNSSASSIKALTITNQGIKPLTLSSVAIAGPNSADFTQTNNCTTTAIAVGANCTVNVVFKATVAGREQATLTIGSNASTSPQTVSLAAAGITFAAPAPGQGGSTSATIAAGTTASYAMQISATGGAISTDQLTLALSCSGAPTDAACTVPGSVVATPGAPAAFTVKVTTTAHGTASLNSTFSEKGLQFALIPIALVLMGVAGRRRMCQGLSLLGLLAVFASLVACGEHSNNSNERATGTPSGSYNLTVKATSGTVSQSVSLTLIVQ